MLNRTVERTRYHRQFMWGLARGVNILAFAGAFWFCVAAFSDGFRPWPAILIALGFSVIVIGGSRAVRRKAAGFKYSELKEGTELQRKQNRKLIVGFRWVGITEMFLVWISVSLCYWLRRADLIWPSIAFAVSLHFALLAPLFRLQIYYATSVIGCAISLIGISMEPQIRLLLLGSGMGAVMWGTSVIAILSADRLAEQASEGMS